MEKQWYLKVMKSRLQAQPLGEGAMAADLLTTLKLHVSRGGHARVSPAIVLKDSKSESCFEDLLITRI